jgi:GGDEF domain-containing protein
MSVTTYSPADNPTPSPDWQKLALGLLHDLREHATFLKEEQRDELRRELDEVVRALQDSPSASVLQISTSTLAEKLPQYFVQTQKEIDSSLSELRQLTSVLMNSLAQVEQTDHGTAASLLEIEQIVQSARSPGELAVAKIHLVQALERLRAQTEAKREAHHQLLTTLQERARALELAPTIEASLATALSESEGAPAERSLASTIGPADPITGLYGRQAAEAFLVSLSEKSKANSYIVAFYVQRMELINSRFGDRMGTDVLCCCAQHFAKLVQPADQLFRWRGPGFVAVLARGRSMSEVRQEVNAAYRTRMTFEGVDNSVIIPLSIVTQVWPARKAHAAEMVHNIETFFSLPSTRAVAEADAVAQPEPGEEDFAEEPPN